MLSYAFDRASARNVDQDGHLFVEATPISMAAVNPYYGHEIPDSENLGLDPNRIYQMLRPADELSRAADTFRGKPLLLIHKPINASSHPRSMTIGSIGTDVRFQAPYLMAPLSVWDAEAIALIESGQQRELSSSYHYTPDMTPGMFEGDRYDGRMTRIRANHVALVREGRAGPSVVVLDGALSLSAEQQFHRFLGIKPGRTIHGYKDWS